ncbi:D-amino-acid oxidase-like [Xenia sp. Carnegie-2017]|uniref:D-amino-acid oxidase-like n=1 Tax=Xenia sp. Carnegie-2017 TaxID=2897299 RepID=UPI001F047D70|nr:D-amino-acid oxidase-like [Xenia sp. Carnegie-2017]
MSASGRKVAIIGAGICGISSAICLQKADPSLDITLISEKFSPNLTSNGAAGFWDPVFLKNTPVTKIRKWGETTFKYLKSIVDSNDAHKYQMKYLTVYELHDQPAEKSELSDIFISYEQLSNKEIRRNFPSDIVTGFVMRSIIIPGTPYLNIKMSEFQQKGGKIIQRKVKSFDEFAGEYDIVINCAGLGARELCNDDTIQPFRGQVVKMKAPWIKNGYILTRKKNKEKFLTTYIFPRAYDVIVGGTLQPNNWDTTINDKETEAIIERASELEPTIKNEAVIIEAWAGLRPVRDSVRLEHEIINVSTKYGSKMKLQVVHNYGHGGGGLSLFWGCAVDVRDLVLSSLMQSNL